MNLRQRIKQKEEELIVLREQLNSSNPQERIKDFYDACEDQGINPNDPKFLYSKDKEADNSGVAFERLKVIRNALLEGKELIWGNDTPSKYFPYFNLSKLKGSGFFNSRYSNWGDCGSCVSSRLGLDSSKRAIYFGSQFESDWYEYMVEHKIE